MAIFWWVYKLYFLENVLKFILFLYTKHFGVSQSTLISLFLLQLLETGKEYVGFMSAGSFHLEICDKEFSGCFMTLISSIYNVSHMWTSTLALYVLDVWEFDVLVYLTWLFAVIYKLLYREKVESLQKLDKSQWKIF